LSDAPAAAPIRRRDRDQPHGVVWIDRSKAKLAVIASAGVSGRSRRPAAPARRWVFLSPREDPTDHKRGARR
jgi:hypothetical protein